MMKFMQNSVMAKLVKAQDVERNTQSNMQEG